MTEQMEKNRNTILVFYAVLSLVVILTSLTDFKMQNIGYSLVTIELIVAYIARARWPKNESFEQNHSTFIIKTIWIYTVLFTIGAVAASYQIWDQGNRDAIQATIDDLMAGGQPSEDSFNASMNQYLVDNRALVMKFTRLWLCPAQLYLVWRILQGGERAFKGYRIANPKRWF